MTTKRICFWQDMLTRRARPELEKNWPEDEWKNLCGRGTENTINYAEDVAEVTCKDCLKLLNVAVLTPKTEPKYIADLTPTRAMKLFGGEAPKFDPVSKPKHYNAGKVECIVALEAATTGLEGIEAVCTANAIKYLWRWKQKNGVEDLKKALWYTEHLVKHLTAEKKS